MNNFVRLVKITEWDKYLCVSDDLEIAPNGTSAQNGEFAFFTDSETNKYCKSAACVITVLSEKRLIVKASDGDLVIDLTKIIVGGIVIMLGVGRAGNKTFFVIRSGYSVLFDRVDDL